MRTAPRPLADILGSTRGGLRSLRKRVTFLQEIQTALDHGLPASAHGHVRVADYTGGSLVLMVDSGVWATRLRYEQDAMLRSLAGRLRLEVARIEIRVRPAALSQASAPRPRTISPAARRLIANCAGYVDNPELERALTRLAAAGLDTR